MRIFPRKLFIHNLDSGYNFELFLLSAAISILVIRFFLYTFGYPQFGGGSFHVAHMLWGGFLMVVATVFLLAFFGRSVKRLSAIIGGIGFGAFIDELGKFITRDNDYFFQPTIALIYVIFVVLFLVFRFIQRQRRFSQQEYLAYAFDLVRSIALDHVDLGAKEKAHDILEKCDIDNPTVVNLKRILEGVDVKKEGRGFFLERWESGLKTAYRALSAKPWFKTTVIIFFLLYSLFSLLRSSGTIQSLLTGGSVYFISGAELVSSSAAAIVSVIGMIMIFRSRLSGYRFFRDSLLISIFLTQFFDFYTNQLRALVGLGVNLAVLLILEFMIFQEEHPRLK